MKLSNNMHRDPLASTTPCSSTSDGEFRSADPSLESRGLLERHGEVLDTFRITQRWVKDSGTSTPQEGPRTAPRSWPVYLVKTARRRLAGVETVRGGGRREGRHLRGVGHRALL